MALKAKDEIRPNWGPKQVRTVKQIRLLNIYERIWTFDGGSTHKQTIVISLEPYQNFGGEWKYKCAIWPLRATSNDNLQIHLCSDSSITPYTDGLWNLTTHLKKTDRRVGIGEFIIAFIKLVINKRIRFKLNQTLI